MPKPHKALMERRIVQVAIQNRSTDPKNKGDRTKTAIVTQSWTKANVTPKNRHWPSSSNDPDV
jgi:hypothetical protein